jgi:hypothetical protein
VRALTPAPRGPTAHLSWTFHVLALPCLHRREDLLLRPTHVRLFEVSRGKQANFPAERMRPEIAPDGGLAAPGRSWDAEQFAGALRRPVTRKSLKPLHVGWATPLACGRESLEEDNLGTHRRVAVVVYVCESSTSCSRWTGAMARSTSRSTKNRRSSPSLRPSSRCCSRPSASRTMADRVARLYPSAANRRTTDSIQSSSTGSKATECTRRGADGRRDVTSTPLFARRTRQRSGRPSGQRRRAEWTARGPWELGSHCPPDLGEGVPRLHAATRRRRDDVTVTQAGTQTVVPHQCGRAAMYSEAPDRRAFHDYFGHYCACNTRRTPALGSRS